MEKDFNKKSLQEKLTTIRKQLDFSNKEQIISEGKRKYDIANEDLISRVSVIKNVKASNIVELNKQAEKSNTSETNIEKHIISIGEHKLKEVSEEALYIMEKNLNASNLDLKINEAETYFDSMPESVAKNNLYKKLDDLKQEIDTYKTYGIFNKSKVESFQTESVNNTGDDYIDFEEIKEESLEKKNNLETPLSQEEFTEKVDLMDDKNITQLEKTEILDESNPNKKEKAKKLFKGITKVVALIGTNTGKLVQMTKRFDKKIYQIEKNFFDGFSDKNKDSKNTENNNINSENSKRESGDPASGYRPNWEFYDDKNSEESTAKAEEDKEAKRKEVKRRAKNINKIRETKKAEEKAEWDRQKKVFVKAGKDGDKEAKRLKKEADKKEAENFIGREYFTDDFKGKAEGNFLTRKINRYGITKERKALNSIYESKVKKLNDKYFADLLGEERLKELRNIENKDERRQREKEMIEDIASKVKRSLDRKEIFEKLKIKHDTEDDINERRKKIENFSKGEAMRRRFSTYIEKDILYYKNKIQELKKRGLLGDKAQIKRLESKIKSLNGISRVKIKSEKVNLEENEESEKVKERKEKLRSLGSKEKLEKAKKDLIKDLKKNGSSTLTSLFNGTFGALYKGGKSGIMFGNIGEGVGVWARETGKGTLGFIGNFLKLLFQLGIDTGKLGYRYVKK